MRKQLAESTIINPDSNLVVGEFKGSPGGKSLYTTIPYRQGDVICAFDFSAILSFPTSHTLQVSDDVHIILNPLFLQYINHSCSPNVFFDTAAMQLVCLRHIEAGEELFFFYPSTEWSMANPFECRCGSPGCIREVKGAMYLSPETLKKHKLTRFIKKKLRLK